MSNLFCFGWGYVTRHLTSQLKDWRVNGTHRTVITDSPGLVFHAESLLSFDILDQYTHFLISIPPQGGSDLVLDFYASYFKNRASSIQWIGYLSATSVYGDHQGRWVHENTAPLPSTQRGQHRLEGEKQWLNLYHSSNCPVHIFRLSSIYGPGRSPFDRMGHTSPLLIDKKGHYFSRAHVGDICQVLRTSLFHPCPGEIYNISDDLPAENATFIEYAYSLLGQAPPPRIPFATAPLSPAMQEYYKENKRINNSKIKQDLGIHLLYPTYKEGLKNCLDLLNGTPENL